MKQTSTVCCHLLPYSSETLGRRSSTIVMRVKAASPPNSQQQQHKPPQPNKANNHHPVGTRPSTTTRPPPQLTLPTHPPHWRQQCCTVLTHASIHCSSSSSSHAHESCGKNTQPVGQACCSTTAQPHAAGAAVQCVPASVTLAFPCALQLSLCVLQGVNTNSKHTRSTYTHAPCRASRPARLCSSHTNKHRHGRLSVQQPSAVTGGPSMLLLLLLCE